MKIIKRLLPYLKPYRGTIIFTLTLGVLLNGVTLGTAKLVKIIFDDIFVDKNVHMLKVAPLIIIGLYVVSGVLRFGHMYLLRYMGDVIAFDIRNELHVRYAKLSLDFHAENSSGALISKTMNDVIQVQSGLTLLSDVVREPINAVLMLGYLFYTDWKLTCLIIVVAPILIFFSNVLGKSVRKYSFIQQEILEQFTNVLKETLDGMRIVKAFSLEKHMEKRFLGVTTRMLAIRRKILSREEITGPVFELIAAITFAGILYFAGSQVVRGETTAGAFTSFIFILGTFQRPIQKLQDAHVRLQHTIAATTRIVEILDTPITVTDPVEAGRVAKRWPQDWQTVEFKNVHFGYKTKHVLNGVDLTVNRGEIVAIVGSSGAGKTTMVNLLPRFYDVTLGGVEIGGVDIRDMTLHDLRAHIGLVTQDVFLFNETIRDNVLAGFENTAVEVGTAGDQSTVVEADVALSDVRSSASEGESKSRAEGPSRGIYDRRINEAIKAAHAADFVSRMAKKLDTVVGERGSQLSGGERQRISIARALFKNTPILILDEATSSLDSESEKIVQRALDELMKGRTTFVIAHRLSTIQKADRIIVLSDGKIVEQGSHAELLRREGAYHRLHVNQFGQLA